MGPYPLNMVRQLFNAEPIEVAAVGVHTPGSRIDTWDTVTVSLRFPEERLAQFTVADDVCCVTNKVDASRVI